MSTVETLRRLGVVMETCPTCKKTFNASRSPRFWINALVDGELVMSKNVKELCCSYECGEKYCAELRVKGAELLRAEYGELLDNDRIGFVCWRGDSEAPP